MRDLKKFTILFVEQIQFYMNFKVWIDLKSKVDRDWIFEKLSGKYKFFLNFNNTCS